jgi:4-amino-4-deoxy-L-arabinose transferase-like glycosyltransferase
MGLDGAVYVDEKMENSGNDLRGSKRLDTAKNRYILLAVLLIAGVIYLGCIVSPPSLMDDVDAVQAQIARNMPTSGDWVTARLDGVVYLEKAPFVYWAMAVGYVIFGGHDWVARIPIALSAIALCCLTAAFGLWAFGRRAGFYSGLCMATCIGLFLFTRVLIPDVILTFTVALSLWAFLRALDEDEPRPRFWAFVLAASLGLGLLLKSLIGVLFPLAAGVIYLSVTHQLFSASTWRRLRPFSGFLITLLIAAPWHILATLRNPPYFAFTLHSRPGQYHGFFWFFFINEQLLRFLNLRYPRDYSTVPRLYFWLLHLVWLFPWSVYLPAIARLSFRPADRASRTRLLALCWAVFVLIFFTFSTTQEYYSMPCYPALALLLGSAMAMGGHWIRRGTRLLSGIAVCAALATFTLFFLTRNLSTPGDISHALSEHPGAYKLSLGHMRDLTLASFAYLRGPLLVASVAFWIGTFATLKWVDWRAFLATALMMVLFFHAARIAMAVFDPYMSSRALAEAILRSPEGTLIVDHHYYTFSSVFFYTNRPALLRNGRFYNLEYGAYAPGAPDVFIDDSQFKNLWYKPKRFYIVAKQNVVPQLESMVGTEHLNLVAASGGKVVLTNIPIPVSKGEQP